MEVDLICVGVVAEHYSATLPRFFSFLALFFVVTAVSHYAAFSHVCYRKGKLVLAEYILE